MAENIREIVLDMLVTMEKEKQFSNRLIKAVLDKYDYLETRDKAFIKRVTEGCVERRIELDYYLNAYSSVPVNKMKPLIRCLMRMSVYQLLFMDNVPDSAVVNEACKLAMKRKFTNLKGFVNGVLRNISRNKENLPKPDAAKEPVKAVSVRYSMPEWLVERWFSQYGRELTEQFLAGLLAVHPVSARFDVRLSAEERDALKQQIAAAGVVLTESPYLEEAFCLEHCDNITGLPGFTEGKWTVQDVSSALAVEAAKIGPEDIVLDACAAPGGKSILASERALRVISRDVSEEKTDLIRENAERMQADNITVEEWDATVEDVSKRESVSVLLLDVPCSGLGILGKKRDIKYHIEPEGLKSLAELQKQIVDSTLGCLKPGGTLVYSTCTINPEENEKMVAYLTEELGMIPLPLEGRVPERLLAEKKQAENLRKKTDLSEAQADACIQLFPGVMQTDGFFFAVLQKPMK